MEIESVKGLLWYAYYRVRYFRLGGNMVLPASLEKLLLPYAKFIVALAGLAAIVAVHFAAGPPGWANMVIAAAAALGVALVPNKQVDAVLSDGIAAVRAGEAAVSDAKAGRFPEAQNDVAAARRAVQDGIQTGEQIYRELPKP